MTDESVYLDSIKGGYSLSSDVCRHNPKCFCRQDYKTAKLILQQYKLKTVFPSNKSKNL